MKTKEKNEIIKELEDDIDEFKQILEISKRQNVKKVLEAWIEKMEYEKNGMEIVKSQYPQKLEQIDEEK